MNHTILYDHCKSHAAFVNSTTLATAAAMTPFCRGNTSDCIDDVAHLKASNIFLTRGECRTYTGRAVENTRDVYSQLGAGRILYFDQCNTDGSHKKNDTLKMCLDHVFGPSAASAILPGNPLHNYMFPQGPWVTDRNVGFGEYGFM